MLYIPSVDYNQSYWGRWCSFNKRGKSILANNFVTKMNNFYNINSDFLMRRPNQPSVR